MKNVVIYHKSDYDGICCREIAKRFMPPDTIFIGWDYGDDVPAIGTMLGLKPGSENEIQLIMLDLAIGPLMDFPNLIWIDHHRTSIERYGKIGGFQLDGVAACRLTWSYFTSLARPAKNDFMNRKVLEPLAVTLIGEFDVWDHTPSLGSDITFQFGLDSVEVLYWSILLDQHNQAYVNSLLEIGASAQRCYRKRDADIVNERSFVLEWEGLKFLALNTARCNSVTFASRDTVENGHDALMGFYFNGRFWSVSLYHAVRRQDIDLSKIAVKYGGGGHAGACGFTTKELPFFGLLRPPG